MAKIVVIGAGMMGSAFSHLLADCGHDVRLVGTHIDRLLIQGVRDTGIHPKLKVDLAEGIAAYNDNQLGEALLGGADLIVLGVNSAGVDWAVETLGNTLSESIPIIMLTKGMAVRDGEIQILPTVVQKGLEKLGLTNVQVGAVAGPCIAGELAAGRDSSIVITHQETVLLDWLVSLVSSAAYCHARPSSDVIGVEICAALKNYYALGVGFARGQLEVRGAAQNGALMNNVSAGLFVQAVAEMKNLLDYFGGEPKSVYGLAGVGDLYVTCQAGRNSRMGQLLGAGLHYREAKARYMPDDTVEGAELVLTIGQALNRLIDGKIIDRNKLPLGMTILNAIYNDRQVQINWDEFYA